MSTKTAKTLLVIVYTLLFLFQACTPHPYYGDNPELYTAAIYNVVGWKEMGARTEIVEKDNYGRVLFKYLLKDSHIFRDADGNTLVAYLIAQKSDETYVWFIEDECFELFRSEKDVNEERISDLKRRNGWNEDLRTDSFSSRKILKGISRKFYWDGNQYGVGIPVDVTSSFHDIEQEIKYIFNLDFDEADGELFDIDVSGRELYYFRTIKDIGGITQYTGAYLLVKERDMAVNKDSVLIELEDAYDYRDSILKLKNELGWKSVVECSN